MAPSNGNSVTLRVIAIVASLFGLFGTAYGIASVVGPRVQIAQHERAIVSQGEQLGAITVRFERHEAAQTEAIKAMDDKLDRLLRLVGGEP